MGFYQGKTGCINLATRSLRAHKWHRKLRLALCGLSKRCGGCLDPSMSSNMAGNFFTYCTFGHIHLDTFKEQTHVSM